MNRCLVCLALLLVPVALAWGGAEVHTDQVSARLVAERPQVAPGETLDLALVLDIRPGWHTYWKNPGDSGEAPRLNWDLPAGVAVGPIRWPYPSLIRVGPLANYGYSGRATHLVSLSVPVDWPLERPLTLRVRADWLVCEEHCIPEGGDLDLTLDVVEPTNLDPPDPALADIFAPARAALPQGPIDGGALIRTAAGMRLQVPGAALHGRPETVWFFADRWGLIDHAAAQPWRWEREGLSMDLTPGDAPGASVSGLLVVTSAGRTQAWTVSADLAPGPVEPSTHAGQAAGQAAGVPPSAPAAPAGPDLGLPMALLLALAGGMILNLMPCVFPILAMKALSLASQAGVDGRERAQHALAYTGGVTVFFALIAVLLLGLRAGGQAVGWGFQLQYPPFVALMAYVFLTLGLSLTGALTLGSRIMGLGAAGPRNGLSGAFVTGGLAALVAAPCTAPFMGAALGYAVTQAWYAALAVILTLGFGLALPFVVLSRAPGLVRHLPRPGPWMDALKQFLAFPMFATAAWLVWVLSVQSGPPGVAAVLAGMVLLALGLWAREGTRNATGTWRALGLALAWGGLGVALYLGLTLDSVRAGVGRATNAPDAVLGSEAYTAERLDHALREGRQVLVNMTAAWCITCLVNERVALGRPAVAAAMERRGVLYLKGDWTRRDPAITAYLARFGRNGVPLYVWYPIPDAPQVLPQILTEGLLLAAFDPQNRGKPE